MAATTKQLAGLIVAARADDLPTRVVEEAQRCILHWIGCSIAGSRQPSVERALATVDELSGPRSATLLGRREKLDISHAAFVNGVSADVLSFSDTHPATLIHAGGVVGSAALALAERHPVSGRDFVHAFVLGFEVACRIGLAIFPWHYARGWHITGTAGIFGAAVAAGRLLRLDTQRMSWALGIAATQSAGLREMFGSMAKNLHIGRAAQGGLFAALLASKGFTSSETSLEAPRGFMQVMGDRPPMEAICAELGERFEILSNTYKPYPCGVVMHPVIEACILLAGRRDFDLSAIHSIDLRCNPLVAELTGNMRPSSMLEAKLSVSHAAAVALVNRAVGLREFTQECVFDPQVVTLRERVTLMTDPRIREDECHVSIKQNNGTALEEHIDHVLGSTQRPMTGQAIEDKFRGLASTVLPTKQVAQLVEVAGTLFTSNDAAELARLSAFR